MVEVYVDQTRAEAGIRPNTAAWRWRWLLLLLLAAVAGWRGIRHLRERRHVEERVHYLAQHDILSGALSRASFGDALQQAVARHARSGGAFAVLCIDLDGFKEVNDAFGHAAGDEVLRRVTERLRGVLRHGDAIARLGGDEFAVLQDDVGAPSDVSRLAQRVVEVLAEPHESRAAAYCAPPASAPRSSAPTPTTCPTCCTGRPGAVPRQERGPRRLQLLRRGAGPAAAVAARLECATCAGPSPGSADAALPAAVRRRWPVAGRLRGAAALAAPGARQRAAGRFIGVAESSGLIRPLGAWVLKRACREAAGWPEALAVSVNLSAAQFRSDELMATVPRRWTHPACRRSGWSWRSPSRC